MENFLLRIQDIWKIYPNGIRANKAVNLDIKSGGIHTLLGENGAGKSTLMNIIFGLIRPTKGRMLFKGESYTPESSEDAIKKGVGMVHQHFRLVQSMTALENITLGMEPLRGFIIDQKEQRKMVREATESFNLPLPFDTRVKDLSLSLQQRVEIIKTLIRKTDLIILDEPTGILTPQEKRGFFHTLKRLRQHGKTILFITHKLSEVKEISDTVSIMRDGTVKDSYDAENIQTDEIIESMLSETKPSFTSLKTNDSTGEILLKTEGLCYKIPPGRNRLEDISFSLQEGEILGLAGISHEGPEDLIHLLFGLKQPDCGRLILNGRPFRGLTPEAARKAGIALIPSDRINMGSAIDLNLADNLMSDKIDRAPFSRNGLIEAKPVRQFVQSIIQRYGIAAQNPNRSEKILMRELSGGNIQKAVVAREISSDAGIILAENPTRGMDVSSADFILNTLIDQRNKGKSVLFYSIDLTELIRISDRIMVLSGGRVVGLFNSSEGLTEGILGRYMLDLNGDERAKSEKNQHQQ